MSTVLSIQVEFTQYFFIMCIAELSMTEGYGILACIWFVQFMERHLGEVYLSLFFPYVASFTLIRFYLFVRREKNLPGGMNVRSNFRSWVSEAESVLVFLCGVVFIIKEWIPSLTSVQYKKETLMTFCERHIEAQSYEHRFCSIKCQSSM